MKLIDFQLLVNELKVTVRKIFGAKFGGADFFIDIDFLWASVGARFKFDEKMT